MSANTIFGENDNGNNTQIKCDNNGNMDILALGRTQTNQKIPFLMSQSNPSFLQIQNAPKEIFSNSAFGFGPNPAMLNPFSRSRIVGFAYANPSNNNRALHFYDILNPNSSNIPFLTIPLRGGEFGSFTLPENCFIDAFRLSCRATIGFNPTGTASTSDGVVSVFWW
jgi:hypothetical protein